MQCLLQYIVAFLSIRTNYEVLPPRLGYNKQDIKIVHILVLSLEMMLVL